MGSEMCIRDRDRFNWRDYYDADKSKPGKTCSKWGGFIPDIASFDPKLFSILPAEAAQIDPRQRLLLLSTWRTLEDAGIEPMSLQHSNTGVFIAGEVNEYDRLMQRHGIESQSFLSQADSMLANRISYCFNLAGPSEFINSMCSGFAIALHRAIIALRSGSIDRAIVGAANIMLLPDPFIVLSQNQQLSSSNRVHSFGAGADGYIRAEGVGTILLERSSDAVSYTHLTLPTIYSV